MKKKNLLLFGSAAMLSLALAGSLGASVVASAADLTQDDMPGASQETTVTYSVENTWTVTIPESIDVGGATQNITAKDVVIEKDTALKVSVSSANSWQVKPDGGKDNQYFEYELKSSASKTPDVALTNESVVLEVKAGTDGETSATLTATLKNADDSKYSTGGEAYEDTLTFTVNDAAEPSAD